MSTLSRKEEHLRICLEEDVETPSTWFEYAKLVNDSLPGIDYDSIDLSVSFLSKKLEAPLIISAVTGGIPRAGEINKKLAKAAEEHGIGFGLGSQRAMIEHPEMKDTYYVRDVAPSTLVLANIGLAQLKEYSLEQIQGMVDSVEADGLCVHLNPAQEAFQPEGDHDFSNLFEKLRELCDGLSVPVIGKEVGFGVSRETAEKLKQAGVKAIDVGGFGGTNWGKIEAIRSGVDFSAFESFGIPTAASILEARTTGLPIIATGGLRSGVDAAKAIALGADLAGFALPMLKALMNDGEEGLGRFIEKIKTELMRKMFMTGNKNISDLKNSKTILLGFLKEWAKQRNLLTTDS